MLKKLVILVLSLVLVFSFSGCKKDKKQEINIYIVDGAPTLSVAKLFEENKIDDKKVNINIVKSADDLLASIYRGEVDFAVCPINLASLLYNKNIDIRLMSVNVFGVLHIMGKTETTLQGLKGKTLYNIGKSGTPDITIKYLLNKNGIGYTENLDEEEADKVNLKYVTNAQELITNFKQGVIEYGVLGQPACENAEKIAGVKSVVDLTYEWNKINGENSYTQAGVIVSGKFLKENKELVKKVYQKLSENKEYLLNNYSSLKDLLKNNGSTLNIDFKEQTILNCNLDCKNANVIKYQINNYLKILYDFQKSSIGGTMPSNDFYIDINNI